MTRWFDYRCRDGLDQLFSFPLLLLSIGLSRLTIAKNGVTSTFSYGANLLRYKQIKTGLSGGTQTTHYVDKLLEIEKQGSRTTYRHYFDGVAVLHKEIIGSATTWTLGFNLKDRLGSVITLADENGDVLEHRSYDPFGKPRRGDFIDAGTLQSAIALDPHPEYRSDPLTDRGFTDHEHLDEQQIIHMNGRVFDYNIGRFTSVDPFIQAPSFSQSINPYSYIRNNPLSGTDPSGYESDPPEEETDVDSALEYLGPSDLGVADIDSLDTTRMFNTPFSGNGNGGTIGSTDGPAVGSKDGVVRENRENKPDTDSSTTNGSPPSRPIKRSLGALSEIAAPANNIVRGTGPRGQNLAGDTIRKGTSKAVNALVGARSAGTGRGAPIAVAVIPDENASDSLRLSVASTGTASGFVAVNESGGFGRTIAVDVGAIFIVTLLRDNTNDSAASRGAATIIDKAFGASFENFGIPVIVVAPGGRMETGLIIESVEETLPEVAATVDEVRIR